MKYNLKSPTEEDRAFQYLTELAAKDTVVSITRVVAKRSLSQNRYLHLILGAFCTETGYNMEEAKQLYREVSPYIYKYEKNGRTFWRSTADVSKEEMVTSIDRFKTAAEAKGIKLPDAVDQEWLRQIENDMEHQNQGKYL